MSGLSHVQCLIRVYIRAAKQEGVWQMGDDPELEEMLNWFEARHDVQDLAILRRLGEQFQRGEGAFADSAFVIMKSALPYIETMEQYRCGHPTPPRGVATMIEDGLGRLFPEIGLAAFRTVGFVNRVRNGMLHTNVGRGGVGLTREISLPIELRATEILINPYLFVLRLAEDLERYLNDELRGPTADPLLISNFKSMYMQELQPPSVCTTTPSGNPTPTSPAAVIPSTTPAANLGTTIATTTTSTSTTPGANPRR